MKTSAYTTLLLMAITFVTSFPLTPVMHKIASNIEPEDAAVESLSNDSEMSVTNINSDKLEESSLESEVTSVESLKSNLKISVIDTNIDEQEESRLDTRLNSLKNKSKSVTEGTTEEKDEPEVEVSRAKRSPGRGRKKGYEAFKIDPQQENLRFILQN
ncbi:uncharacterized protein LOC136036994 [Artemia franciscana]|uniref:Uncharacterized protein n=1 Tax=Artemia franciscana TaxID=6661 RepID=A0AA88LBP3_ARTSF|nr:hypothetical protein QYM36_005130 [Artemia franciscana]